MSIEMISWVFRQNMKTVARKAVMLAYADFAGHEGETWATVDTLAAKTDLNRKTVIRTIAELEEDGFLLDSGKRAGGTSRIKVYRIITEGHDETTLDKQYRKRNDSEFGMVPESARNSTNFSRKQSQKVPEMVPVLGTKPLEPSEPLMNREQTLAAERDDWQGYEDTLGNTPVEPMPRPSPRQPSKAAIHDQKCQDLLAAFRHARLGKPLSDPVPYTFRRDGLQLAAAMVKDGITPEQIINATKTALAKYARPDMVTFQAVGRNIETLLSESSRPVPSYRQRSYQMPDRDWTVEDMARLFPEIAERERLCNPNFDLGVVS